MNIYFPLRNGGPGTYSSLVPFEATSDTGLKDSGNSSISTGDSVTSAQPEVGPEHYGSVHVFTIVVDPANATVESVETNNVRMVRVTLNKRPINAQGYSEVLCENI